MPNWCSTTYGIVKQDNSPEAVAQLLKFKLMTNDAISDSPTSFKSAESSWGSSWLGNIYLAAGYTEKDIADDKGWIACRGEICSVDINDDNVILVCSTAWNPMDASMDRMLSEKFPKLKLLWIAEEPGCEIYEKYDPDGILFHDHIILETDSYTEYYGEGSAEAERFLKDIKDLSDLEFVNIDDAIAHADEIREAAAKKDGIDLEKEDYYLSIHEFIEM